MEYIKMNHDEMVDCIIKNANLFYNGKDTEISDAVYDTMLSMIKDDDPEFNIYDHVVYENDGIEIKHQCEFRPFTKSADIASISTENDFHNMLNEYDILPKFDGSSTVTYYKPIMNDDGSLNHTELSKILSRHDDYTGFLNTNKLRNKVKDRWDATPGVVVQLSEAVCPKYDKDGNPLGRAKANGLINSKYNQDEVDELLTLIPFDYYLYDGSKVPNLDVAVTDYEVFSRIRDKGEWMNPSTGLVYPCDGIVGYPKNREDTCLRIIKLYYSESAESTVTDIDWSISSNSGLMHPVAVFEDVELESTIVSRASLSNYELARSMMVYPGVKVKVAKANMTIPHILEVIDPDQSKNDEYYDNIKCPVCGSPVHQYWKDAICSNPSCDWWLRYMANKIAYGVLGGSNIEQFIWEYLYSETREGVINACKNLFTPDILKKFEDPEFMIDFVNIPRLNSDKRDQMIILMTGGTEANQIVEWRHLLDDSDNRKNWEDNGNKFDIIYAGYATLSDKQYSYLEMFMSHFNALIDIVKS